MPLPRYITIHGHFYQPPRENAWLEAVETQDSAHPFHDWNGRITAECYAPNASARILDARDRILRIVNNYASISFNFGPTLFGWLAAKAPDTYQAVIDADHSSRRRFGGHGSAIAQAYNHMILPLANARDQRTQVRWGIRDFESRFGRKPEGMWLPETAVDTASLEALAAEGIAFTILEPHQAHTVSGDPVDPTKAYRCALPSGASIAIFFYDGPISRGVAFENLLARGENLAHRLIDAFSGERQHPQLVNIATDGETYGHHHRYGDMALAYALQYIEEHKLAIITNYGQFLELHPPEEEVEIVEQTAWSCAHGVERWRSDCGCSTGAGPDWNQRWRDPLRRSLDWLRDEAAAIFETKGAAVLRDPWAARDEYIDIILDRSEDRLRWFLQEHQHAGEATAALELLEMQRNAMLMFTSCGWFFNDISGIETVQVLQYAARVVQLAEILSGRQLEVQFRERLAEAHSNLPERGDGRQIYDRDILPMRLDLRRVAAHYAVASLFDHFEDEADVYCYRVKRHDFELQRAGRARMAVASITVTSIVTRETASFEFAVLHLGETELTGGVRATKPFSDYEAAKKELDDALQPGGLPSVIRLLDRFFAETPISIRALFRDEQRRLLNVICDATLQEAESALRSLHDRYNPLMRFHTRLGVPLPKVLQTAAEFDVNLQVRRLAGEDVIPLAELEARLRESQEEHIPLDATTRMAITASIERYASRFADDPANVDLLESYYNLVALVRATQLPVDLREPQNDYYRMKKTIRPAVSSHAGNGSSDATRWLHVFDTLGEQLSISPEAGN